MSLIPQVAYLLLYTPTESSIKKYFKKPKYEIKGVYLCFDISQRLLSYKGLVPLSLLLTQQHKPGKFTWTPHMRRVFMNSSFIAQPAKGELSTSAGNKYKWKPVGLSFSNSFLKWYKLCVLHPLDLQWWTKAAFSVWVFDLNNAIFSFFFGI